MGSESDGSYPFYMIDGDIPDFKFYDFSEEIYYNILPSQDVDEWMMEVILYLVGQVLVLGCSRWMH